MRTATTNTAGSTLGYATPAPPAAGRTLLGHPPGLFVLFVVEMWERFSYYGMRALLVLYLMASANPTGPNPNPGRGMTREAASGLYGWYTGLAYLLPILGGLVADRRIGAHRSVLVGGVLIALGHLALGTSGLGTLASAEAGMAVFVLGLALIVIGTGHFKPNVSVMVGRLYPDGDPRRDGAFTIFYMGINVGAFASALVCGTLGEKVGWHWGFGAAAVGMLLGLAVYLAARPRLLAGVGAAPGEGADAEGANAEGSPGASARASRATAGFFVLALALAAGVALAYHVGLSARVGDAVARVEAEPVGRVALTVGKWALAALVGSAVVTFVAAQPAGDRGPTAAVLLFIVFNAVFWVAFEQAGTSLNLFANDLTDRRLGSLGEVPATWFQSVGALEIVLLAPAFAALWSALDRRGRNPSQAVKVAVALFLLGGGYLFMVAGSVGTTPANRAAMGWLVATYTMFTLGELCLSPTGLAFVTRVSPARFVSLLMGVSFLSNALANWAGGRLAGQVDKIAAGELQLPWYRWFRLGGQADFFFLFVVSSFAAGLLVLALAPLIRRMLGGRG